MIEQPGQCCGLATTTAGSPFDWTLTRADLDAVLAKINEREPQLALVA